MSYAPPPKKNAPLKKQPVALDGEPLQDKDLEHAINVTNGGESVSTDMITQAYDDKASRAAKKYYIEHAPADVLYEALENNISHTGVHYEPALELISDCSHRLKPDELSKAMHYLCKNRCGAKEVLRALMDVGADPAYRPENGLPRTIDEIHLRDLDMRSSGISTQFCAAAENWEKYFAIVTHPEYPLSARKDTHKKLLKLFHLDENSNINPTQREQMKFIIDAAKHTGKEGEPDLFACMMHVVLGTTMCTGSPTRPKNNNTNEFLDENNRDYYGRAIKVLTSHPHNWVEESRQLLDIDKQTLYDVQDMLKAYCEQVVMPGVRFHVDPDYLNCIDSARLFQRVYEKACPLALEGKSLMGLLDMSYKWHNNQATIDTQIRTIAHKGSWYPLLAHDEVLHVPDNIAKGWTIRNISSMPDLTNVGTDMKICIAGKAEMFRKGVFHAFVFCDENNVPQSTWRLSLNKGADSSDNEKIEAASIRSTLYTEERTGRGNDRNFSEKIQGSYEWLKSNIENGAIKLQDEKIGQTQESIAKGQSSQISGLERMVGFHLTGPEAEEHHQKAYDLWANSTSLRAPREDALNPRSPILPPPDVPGTVPFTRAMAIKYKAYAIAPKPDIGSSQGKFMIPEKLTPAERLKDSISKDHTGDISLREASVDHFHYGTELNNIVREAVTECFTDPEIALLPERKYTVPGNLRLNHNPSGATR